MSSSAVSQRLPVQQSWRDALEQPVVLRLSKAPGHWNLATEIIRHNCQVYSLDVDVADLLLFRVTRLLDRLIRSARSPEELIELSIHFHDGVVQVWLHNHGYPVLDVEDLDLQVVNLGRRGQRYLLLDHQPRKREQRNKPVLGVLSNDREPLEDPGEVEYRGLRDGEEYELSRLFYRVYGYRYINEIVYYPKKLRQLIEEGRLKSQVAVTEKGQIAAHVGMLRLERTDGESSCQRGHDSAVHEIGMGLTDPGIKSRGLFSHLFGRIMAEAEATAMSYCVFDYVTNHDYSQKLVSKYDYCDMAINIGAQISETQVKLSELGIGVDSQEMDRYSILLGIKPFEQHPFGQSVELPPHLGEEWDFLLEPLGIRWVPAPRFSPLPRGGQYRKTTCEVQRTVHFDFFDPGYTGMERVVVDWRHLMRQDFRYGAIDLPLNHPGAGQAYDFLARHGFFLAGFVPYGFGNRLALRLQSIGPTRVAFDDIKIASKNGKKLLSLIKRDYERNGLL